ncbi:MAG: flagellar biosynthesis protein FlhB [Chitinivibrionales bacterium]|nr:flagellar biosynthesis protein FlhB [Chitinivibrionales bacterium]
MAEDGFQEKTEAPTEKRRAEAREKGNVPKSTELNSVIILLTGLILLRMFGRRMLEDIGGIFNYYLGMLSDVGMSPAIFVGIFRDAAFMVAKVAMPLVLGILVAGLIANYLQIGVLFTLKPLQPKLEKINPLSGMKRLFSMKSIVETFKNLMKITIIAIIAYITIRGRFFHFMKLADTGPGAIWVFFMTTAFTIVWRIVLVLIILALLDLFYQRYEHEKNLKMTKEEIKEERKQMEGDPQIKSRIRSLQREMARRRMMQEVPKATVVVTNPTYIAIAIRYEPEENATPRVLAKGKRHVAEKIKDTAREHEIPIVEDKPLARAMYDKVEPGEDIPVEFFTAIAEILAYVYRLKNKVAA